MRKLFLIIPFIFILNIGAGAAPVATPSPNPAIPPKSVTPPTTPAVTQNYCPTVGVLVKKDLYWGAPGGWGSYGESWDPKVTRFVKAQWIGINVGKIICIYTSDRKNSFPIALEQKQNSIVISPTGTYWSKDFQGYKECQPLSGDVKDCPFLFEKTQDNSGDIYQGLDFFKGKEHNDDY